MYTFVGIHLAIRLIDISDKTKNVAALKKILQLDPDPFSHNRFHLLPK